LEKIGRKRTDKEKKIKRRRKVLLHLFGNSCDNCGHREISVLEFHHEEPEDKLFNVSGGELTRKWEDILEEVSKCRLLCRNCHKLAHDGDWKHGQR